MPSLSRVFAIARASAHSALGWVAYRLGWLGPARRQYERVLLLRGADFQAYVHLGRIAFDQGDYAGWRREFEHARRTDPIRFARLRHPLELFEPRLAGTQFDPHGLVDPTAPDDGDGFQATDARATWRSLHPFGQRPRDASAGEGFGRGIDLPLAPGYDPMMPGQQLDDRDPAHPLGDDPIGDDLSRDDRSGNDPNRSDRNRSDRDRAGRKHPGPERHDDVPADDLQESADPFAQERQHPLPPPPPDASLTRDDFSSPSERRRFQLRRPIDRQEIARCDLNDLARRLSG